MTADISLRNLGDMLLLSATMGGSRRVALVAVEVVASIADSSGDRGEKELTVSTAGVVLVKVVEARAVFLGFTKPSEAGAGRF